MTFILNNAGEKLAFTKDAKEITGLETPELDHPKNETISEIIFTQNSLSTDKSILRMRFNGSFANAGCNFFIESDGKVIAQKGQTGWMDNRGAQKEFKRICSNMLDYYM
jgi:hypothetical protein